MVHRRFLSSVYRVLIHFFFTYSFNESFAPALPPFNPKISSEYVRLLVQKFNIAPLIASLESSNQPRVRFDNTLRPQPIIEVMKKKNRSK